MGLRDQLRALKAAAKKLGIGKPAPLPEVIVCFRREGEETRKVGLHFRDNGRGSRVPEIVFDPDAKADQVDKSLSQLREQLNAPDTWRPLVIAEGLDEITHPADLPRE
jgi:hypothetical protein